MSTASDVQPPPPRDDALLQRVANELQWKIAGEVRFDPVARSLYATDASPYEIHPYGVVLPKTVEDVRVVVDVANTYGLPLLPRGGGTSLAGQTVGEAIVLDFSKYMDRVLELSPEERWVKVQPGVVRDNLNLLLAPHKLQFTPDVATSSRANIGGMVANNSSGTRSIKYGKTVDQVVRMTVMLSDGTVTEFRALSKRALQEKLALGGREGEIYRTVFEVISEHEDEIRARYPKVMRRVGGYNLDELIGGKPFNLAKLITGSEGTLAIILDVTLKLEPVPNVRHLVMLHFHALTDALRAVPKINRHDPSCVEILDETLLELGLANPKLAPLIAWRVGEPKAVLMVEFDGESVSEVDAKVKALRCDPELAELSYAAPVAASTEEQAAVWEFRKGGLGIFATMKGDAKPTPFIEDAAIPVEHLPEYIPQVIEICAKHGVITVMYAHASVGVIHVRPVLNLKDPADIAKFAKISEEVFWLVKRYGGAWSGEHGDGLIRSYQNRNMFGDVIYEDFRRIKGAFDPKGILNPGKIVDSPPPTENLRYGEDYHSVPINTVFDFSEDGGYLRAIEMCSGVGHCRKTTTGTMCPSFMATRDEDHSTRGRANVLREALTGRLPGGLTSREVYDVLELCLECKACKAECPSRVDMAKIKYEFLQHYHDAHGTPLPTLALGNVAKAAPLGRLAAPIVNRLLPARPVRYLIEKAVGIDRRRTLPAYADASFAQLFRQQRLHPKPGAPKVALFADTWTMYHDTRVGRAAVKVLDALGYEVELVPYRCCGRPLISKGLLRQAKKQAQTNVEALGHYVRTGVPVVGLEPSCVAAFQDDYRDLVPGELTEAVAKHVKMIDQFLAKAWTAGELEPEKVFAKLDKPVMLHGHCQQRAVMGTAASRALLGWLGDGTFEIDAGCCGMAGSFGYSHFELSMKIGEQRLFPAVREHEGLVAACGFSCRHQIKDGTGKRARHVIELLANAVSLRA